MSDSSDFNGAGLLVVPIVFLSLTYLSVGLRFLVRIWIMKSFQWDDWFMLCAQIVYTISCVFILLGVHFGLGRHNDALADAPKIQALKYQTLATLTYVLNMMFIKLSIAIFLLRISPKKRYTWTLKISMGIVTIWSLVIFFWDTFQCSPVAFQWDFTIVGGVCAPGNDFVAASYSISVMTILTDWMYALIPIPMIWGVQMTTQKKLTVAFVLSLGVFASLATLIRVKYQAELGTYADILFTGTQAMIWTLVEPGVAITAASLITIRPLLRALKFHGFGSSKSGSRSRSQFTGTNNNNLSRSRPMVSQRENFQMQNWSTLSTAVGESSLGKGGMGTRVEAASDAGSEELIFGSGEGGEGVVHTHTGPKTDEEGIRRTRTVTVVIDPNGGRGVKR